MIQPMELRENENFIRGVAPRKLDMIIEPTNKWGNFFDTNGFVRKRNEYELCHPSYKEWGEGHRIE